MFSFELWDAVNLIFHPEIDLQWSVCFQMNDHSFHRYIPYLQCVGYGWSIRRKHVGVRGSGNQPNTPPETVWDSLRIRMRLLQKKDIATQTTTTARKQNCRRIVNLLNLVFPIANRFIQDVRKKGSERKYSHPLLLIFDWLPLIDTRAMNMMKWHKWQN